MNESNPKLIITIYWVVDLVVDLLPNGFDALPTPAPLLIKLVTSSTSIC